MRTLLLFWLSGLCCFGQGFTDVGFVWSANYIPPVESQVLTNNFSDDFYPTNISGYPAYTWWVANNVHGTSYTNSSGGVTNWPDFAGSNFHLTNTSSGAFPYISNNWLNARSVVSFDGQNDILRSTAYTNNTDLTGYDIVLVAAFDWTDGNLHRIIGDANYYFFRNATTGRYSWGGYSPDEAVATNHWMVIYLSINKTATVYIYTNNVVVGNGGGSDFVQNGIAVGGRMSDGANATKMLLAEVVCYATNLPATERGTLFSYLTNKYFLSP